MTTVELGLPTGGFTEEVFTDTHVIKTTREAFHPLTASKLASDLERYAHAFTGEALSIPELTDIHVEPATMGQRLVHTMERCHGDNLASLDTNQKCRTICNLLGRFVSMTEANGILRVPMDAQVLNFHVTNEGEPVLVDLAPPLPRHADKSFPIENIPHARSLTRRCVIPYISGTLEGASLRLLSTAVIGGLSPRRQVRQLFDRTSEWCYDAIPPNMPTELKDSIRRGIEARFLAQWAIADMSGGVKRVRDRIGIASY